MERGPPTEILTDQGSGFTSQKTAQFFRDLGVTHVVSGAYRYSGDGIIEGNHSTITGMASRSRRRVEEMTFWYDHTPNGMVPADAIFQYSARIPGARKEVKKRRTRASPYQVGDSVFVKPANTKCFTSWKEEKITRIVADTVIEVEKQVYF